MGVEVCPVHRSEFKSSEISSIHVVDMNTEESRGLKRSPEEDEDPRQDVYQRQRPRTHQERKEWIAFSLEKLKTHDFRRQVLISNFIRSIHLSMESDGINVPELYYDDNSKRRGPYIPEWRPHKNTTTLDPPPSNSSSDVDSRPGTPSVINSVSQRGMENTGSDLASEYERCFMETDAFKATPFSRTTYERVENGALWTDESDRFSRLNWCSVLTSTFNGSDNSSSDYISDDSSSSTNLHTLMPASTEIEYFEMPSSAHLNSDCPTENTSSASGSSPTSSEDEIFGDVDLTLYDFDCHAMSPPNVAMDPLTAEELVWSLSNDQRQMNSSDRDYATSVST
ncbi:uncharacterized protein [Parasteatoda tepidariorum]|uniref:uncharacterized protein n=1 Tax=Parasteatoda tepidariorum TaxID=114398 RepID=UPI00077FD593|nr:uncharacterized protein LOC107448641 [Parasteatoda tepidariorum]